MSEKPPTYANHLSDLLTGRPHMVREPAQWHERILEGFPMAAVEAIKSRAALTDAEVARLLGVGEATLRRSRASGAALNPATGDRLYRVSKVLAVAIEVLRSEAAAMSWLRRSQPGLGGEVPLDQLVTQAGADEVETLLRRIQHGVYT
jgi:putative toxin-antitoxin system antitoxin component (TIGR02293 family)